MILKEPTTIDSRSKLEANTGIWFKNASALESTKTGGSNFVL
jgi:hypothetical protein